MLLYSVIRAKLDYTILKLQLVNDGINCPSCNVYTDKIHQISSILVRDLSIFGRLVDLKVPLRQFRCNNCNKSSTEILSWLNRKQRQTTRYQNYIYERVSVAGDPPRKELTVKQVSENEKMSVAGDPQRSEDTVPDIFHKVAQLKKKTGDYLNG